MMRYRIVMNHAQNGYVYENLLIKKVSKRKNLYDTVVYKYS